MKLKIIKAGNAYPDYPSKSLDSKGNPKYMTYSKACSVEVDGVQMFAKINHFSKKIELVDGIEFVPGENCESIEKSDYNWKTQDGQEMPVYNIKAKKKDFAPGKSGGYSKIYRTEEQLEHAVQWSINQAKLICPRQEDLGMFFATILKHYSETVKPVDKMEKAIDAVKEAFGTPDLPQEF